MAAKAKFSLTKAPTFPATVSIPIPGCDPIDVKFTFKGRTRAEYKELMEASKDVTRTDTDMVMDVASGWELEDPFTKESIDALCENYIAAPRAIWEKYLSEMVGARLGNSAR